MTLSRCLKIYPNGDVSNIFEDINTSKVSVIPAFIKLELLELKEKFEEELNTIRKRIGFNLNNMRVLIMTNYQLYENTIDILTEVIKKHFHTIRDIKENIKIINIYRKRKTIDNISEITEFIKDSTDFFIKLSF